MEKKFKFSEFAELIGCTPKTVYKMKDRNEIKTVYEKLNGREIQLVITNDDEIEKFRSMNSKSNTVNSYYEDIVTINNDNLTNNIHSQNNNNNISMSEMFDKIIEINEKYNNEIKSLNEELLNSKSQVLYLEDKAGREGAYLNEINELKKENETVKIHKQKVINSLLVVIAILCIILTVIITTIVVTNPSNENLDIKKEPTSQIESQLVK